MSTLAKTLTVFTYHAPKKAVKDLSAKEETNWLIHVSCKSVADSEPLVLQTIGKLVSTRFINRAHTGQQSNEIGVSGFCASEDRLRLYELGLCEMPQDGRTGMDKARNTKVDT